MGNKQKKRKRVKLSKLLKSAKFPKIRKPIAPPGKVFKSKKDYDRTKNKNIDIHND